GAIVGASERSKALKLLLRQSTKRIVHLPGEPLDLVVELLQFRDWVMRRIGRGMSVGLELRSTKRGRRDRKRELTPVIFTAVPDDAGLDGAGVRQLDLEGRSHQHRH